MIRPAAATVTLGLAASMLAPVASPAAAKRNGPIAFVRGGHVWVMRADGSHQRKLAGGGMPSFSPSGKRIVAVGPDVFDYRIFAMSVNGSHKRNLVRRDFYEHPSYSPDGKRIAFGSSDSHLPDQTWMMDANGSHRHLLAACAFYGCSNDEPVFSPDGKTILLRSDRTGTNQFFVMNADGSHVRQLTTNADKNDRSASFSPDGKTILFVSQRTGKEQLFVMNSDGSNVRRLTNDRFYDYDPAFSPDGKTILFTSPRKGKSRLLVMNADGSHVRRLTHDRLNYHQPSWGRR